MNSLVVADISAARFTDYKHLRAANPALSTITHRAKGGRTLAFYSIPDRMTLVATELAPGIPLRPPTPEEAALLPPWGEKPQALSDGCCTPVVNNGHGAAPSPMVEHALALAAEGFYVFQIKPNEKSPPLIKDFPHQASRDPETIRQWWKKDPNANIGISTSKFGDDEALLVVDVDQKNNKDGALELLRLELEGWDLPETYTQFTPTGGRHLVYRVSTPVRQGVNVLALGLDSRAMGGYIVGVGSVTAQGIYTANELPVVQAPEWLIARCGKSRVRAAEGSKRPPAAINQARAIARAIEIAKTAAPAIEGQGGDTTTYQVACRVKDEGVDQSPCVEILAEHWDPRNSPPWGLEGLKEKVAHAYKYGTEPIGANAPESHFENVTPPPGAALHPFEKINQEYAFVMQGGAHILWETTDAKDQYELKHVQLPAFHAKFANQPMTIEKRTKPVSVHWLESKERRSYDGTVFMPGQKSPKRFFNLGRGFTYKPAAPGTTHESVELWKEHLLQNVCGNQVKLANWLTGYLAHLIQRPWEKPRIALVFRGLKGVGKNACIERVAALLGRHALVTAERRYVDGRFNGHLEHCLLLVLDEAFWSGEHGIDGRLKNLITGREHMIEHKGCEPYSAQNLTRVVIIGNEDWLVNATGDERRYACFDVGEGRKEDHGYFNRMVEGMADGGYPVLLRYLRDVDLTKVDLNQAPSTPALLEQKEESLTPLQNWWFECLRTGQLVSGEWEAWPSEVGCERFRKAFQRYTVDRHIKARIPADNAIGRQMKRLALGFDRVRGPEVDGYRPWLYSIPSLNEARSGWSRYIGHTIKWQE